MQKSYTLWASSLLFVLLQNAAAQSVHIGHCYAGCPEGAPAANEIVVRHLFAASINYQTGLADWVAYRVVPGSVGVASLLPRVWESDHLLDRQAQLSVENRPRFSQPDLSNQQDRDYRINEVVINPQDRGRLVPMSGFAGTPFWEDLNYLSIMAPIPSALRLGPWSRLDQAANELALRAGEVYIISGPLHAALLTTSDNESLGNRPSAYFKFMIHAGKVAAFIFPQDISQHSGFCEQLSSIEQLQNLSGLELLPLLAQVDSEDLHLQLSCADN